MEFTMSNWDHMDKKVWKESEVMNEFEKILVKAMVNLSSKLEEEGKVVEAQQAAEISNKLKQINTDVQNASSGMSDFLDTAKNLAADDLKDDKEEQVDEVKLQEEAKSALLEELSLLARTASDDGDYKLAYKIERTIDSILYDEE